MSAKIEYDAQTVIDALRLAFEGTSDNAAIVRVAGALLDFAPESDPKATIPVRLFISAIENAGCTITVAG